MKHTFWHNPKWYSIILAFVMIGFLLVLTTGTLNLVLQEMQDGRGKQDYLKASAAAEGALELALLQIKNKGYGFYDTLDAVQILGTQKSDPQISYSFKGKVNSYSGVLQAYSTEIIPLFWIDAAGNIQNIGTQIQFWGSDDISWNLLSNAAGISWVGNFDADTQTGQKKLVEVGGNVDFSFEDSVEIRDFLSSGSGSYLLLYNASSESQSFSLESEGYFTQPQSTIISSAKLWKYTQNLETTVDNTEFLWILKYSLYSWN